MDLEGLDLKPSEGMLFVCFLDKDEDDEEQTSTTYSSDPVPYKREGHVATVHSAGAKVPYKKGDLVITNQWACDGLKIGPLTLISNYDIVAKIITSK